VHLLSAVHSTRPRPRPHVCQTGQQETLRVLDGARPRATGVLFSRSHTSRHHDLAGYRPHRTHTTPSSIIMTTLAALPARCGLGASTSRRSPTIQVCVHPRHARADRAARPSTTGYILHAPPQATCGFHCLLWSLIILTSSSQTLCAAVAPAALSRGACRVSRSHHAFRSLGRRWWRAAPDAPYFHGCFSRVLGHPIAPRGGFHAAGDPKPTEKIGWAAGAQRCL